MAPVFKKSVATLSAITPTTSGATLTGASLRLAFDTEAETTTNFMVHGGESGKFAA
ncbi:MAG: hypothetical protein WAN11_17450 [Syntrophobacteraceae bacterium]